MQSMVDGTLSAGRFELVFAGGKKLVFHQPVSAALLGSLIG